MTPAHVHEAIEQLSRSERGQQALRDFRAMIENGAMSLDLTNWGAVINLARACGYGGRSCEVRDLIDEKLGDAG